MAPGVIAGYSGALIVLILGLVIMFKPKWYLRLIKWQMEYMWASKFIPSKKTESRMRLMGSLLVLLAALIVCSLYFFGP